MVRGKIQLKRIENATSRQVTFSKRRNGLLKKAYELSVLCDAEVAVIIFSQKGRLYEFSSSNIQKTIERYQKSAKELRTNNNIESEEYMQQLKHETANMAKMMELLEVSQRRLMGQDLGSCSVEELQETEGRLEKSLSNIRARKAQVFLEQMEQLKEKERLLLEERARLCEKCGMNRSTQPTTIEKEIATYSQSSQISEVETELAIGLPESAAHRRVGC